MFILRVGLTLSLVTAIILYAGFLCPYHICISAKMPEAPSIVAKDKKKREEINETVEGNSLKIISFARSCLFQLITVCSC